MNGELPIRVVKLGGSLLNRIVDQRHVPIDVTAWGQSSPKMSHDVLITGGGRWADAIRQLDERGALSVVDAHWLAIRAMSLTAWLFAHVEPAWTYVHRHAELMTMLKDHHTGHAIVYDPAHWLMEEESERLADRLPVGWQVTSDSIAAHLAKRIQASELVLLKSIDAPPASDQSVWRQQAIVDEHFPQVARMLRVSIVNLLPRVAVGAQVAES